MKPLHALLCLALAAAGWTGGRWWRAERGGPVAGGPAVASAVGTPAAGKPGPVDAVALAAFLKDHPGQPLPPDFLASVLADPATAAREMNGLGDQSGDSLRDTARQLALSSPQAMIAFVEATSSRDLQNGLDLYSDAVLWAFSRNAAAGLAALGTLAERKPEVALNIAYSFPPHIPPKDLPAVQAWQAQLAPGRLKDFTLERLVPSLARKDYRAAFALVNALPTDSDMARRTRMRFQLALVRQHGADQTAASREKRLAEFRGVDQEALRQAYQSSRFSELAAVQPEAAFGALATMPAEDKSRAVAELCSYWANVDPARAARHVDQLSPELQAAAAVSLLAGWAGNDHHGAVDWVSHLADGPVKEKAALGLVRGLADGHPVQALEWAVRLADPAVRLDVLRDLAQQARPDEREAVRAAVARLPFTPEERATVLPPPPEPPPAK